MSHENSVRNILGVYEVFTIGGSHSLDSQRGDTIRTLYYPLKGDRSYEEIDMGEKPVFISDKKTILQKEGIVFELNQFTRITLPGETMTIERLVNPQVEDRGGSYIAEIVPGLPKESIAEISMLDSKTKEAVTSDLLDYYPKTVITQGNIFEVYLSNGFRVFVDSPGFSMSSRVDGFAKPYEDNSEGVSIWKIAKEYPQKKSHERLVLTIGLDYTASDNDEDAIIRRSDEFIKAMEIGGEDARKMLAKIARPTIEIKKQSIYS